MARRDVLLVQASTAACEEAVAALVDGRARVVLAVDETDLLPAAEAAAASGFAVVSTRVLEAAGEMPDLSAEDRALLRLIATGASHRDAATALGCSEATAKAATARLVLRLGSDGRAGLVELAARLGLRGGKGSPG